jgi:hypothetical protein
VAGPCKHGYESSCFIKGGVLHDQLSEYQLLNEDSSACCATHTLGVLTV